MPGPCESETVLRSELDRKRSRVDAAHAEYQKMLRQLSHESVSQAEIDRLEEAGRGEMDARQEFWKSLIKLDEFWQKGTLPPDLPETAAKPGS